MSSGPILDSRRLLAGLGRRAWWEAWLEAESDDLEVVRVRFRGATDDTVLERDLLTEACRISGSCDAYRTSRCCMLALAGSVMVTVDTENASSSEQDMKDSAGPVDLCGSGVGFREVLEWGPDCGAEDDAPPPSTPNPRPLNALTGEMDSAIVLLLWRLLLLVLLDEEDALLESAFFFDLPLARRPKMDWPSMVPSSDPSPMAGKSSSSSQGAWPFLCILGPRTDMRWTSEKSLIVGE